MADEEKAPEGAEEVENKGGGIKAMIPLIVILFVFLGAQIGIALFLVDKLSPVDETVASLAEEQKLEEERKKEVTTMGTTLEKAVELTVNIAGTNGERFLVCAVNFEWNAEAHPTFQPEFEKRLPKIRDIIINILSSRTLSELQSSTGKNEITRSILNDVRSIMPEEAGEVRNCFLDKFIIQ
jgi:flagellar protein FliL